MGCIFMKTLKMRTAALIIALLIAALLGVGAYAWSEADARQRAERLVEISGESAMGELTAALDAEKNSLRAAQYATEPGLLSSLCARGAVKAAEAMAGLGALPCASYELARMGEYINASGEFALKLSRMAAQGLNIDAQSAGELADYARGIAQLADGCRRLLVQLEDGALIMDSYGADGQDSAPDSLGYELRRLESELPELPERSRSSPGGADSKPSGAESWLDGKQELSEPELRLIAAELLEIPAARLSSDGRMDCRVPCRSYSVTDAEGRERRLNLALRGGLPVTLTDAERPYTERIRREDALNSAREALKRLGFGELAPIEARQEAAAASFTLAAVQDGVILLPDSISVTVSLESGRIIALDASEYLINHRERGLPAPGLSEAEAIAALPEGVEPRSAALALNRAEGGGEALCYKLDCRAADGADISVFVDAASGKQVEIQVSAAK